MKPSKWAWISLLFSVASTLELKESFREPKNILFGSVGGGSSHINWVLNILEELANRGHNITFVTHDDQIKYGKKHPKFHTISIGPNDVDLKGVGNHKRYLENSGFFNELYSEIHNTYDQKMKAYKNIYETTNIHVALCDHFTVPCIDMTKNVKTPLVITTALAISKDASAPYINNFLESNETTTYGMSFKERFTAKVVEPLSVVLDIYSSIKRMKQKKSDLGWVPTEGIPAFEDDWKDSIKLVNNIFGFEPARPLGPLVELIGPIMSTSYPDLTPTIEAFLNNHEKIAYIAFGQSSEIQHGEINLILTALLDSIERGALDGFLWATRNSDDRFPKEITTASGTTYSVFDMFENKNEYVHFLSWSPQMAILSHPSTVLFVSHGGLASLQEAMYAGVRTALYPFYGDQPSNAYMMRTQHLGVQLSYDMDQTTASDLIERVALDVDGKFEYNVNRFKAMVQIHSKHGILRGADLVEEVIFGSNEDGMLPHRFEVSRDMSIIKSYNLDILAFVLCMLTTFIAAVTYTIYFVARSIKKAPAAKKRQRISLIRKHE